MSRAGSVLRATNLVQRSDSDKVARKSVPNATPSKRTGVHLETESTAFATRATRSAKARGRSI